MASTPPISMGPSASGGIPRAPPPQPGSGRSTKAGSGSNNGALVPVEATSSQGMLTPRGSGIVSNKNNNTSLSSARAKYALVPSGGGGTHVGHGVGGSSSSSASRHAALAALAASAGGTAAPTLSPRNLRDIGKFVDANIKIQHTHRRVNLSQLIPQGPFVQVPQSGDALLQLSIAAIHPKESALDVPLRLNCPEGYHCPVMADPRSNGTIAARIVALLKGAASVPLHWEGDTQGVERGVTKLNAIRDSEMRVAAANRAQQFDKEARALVACGAMYYNAGNMDKAAQSLSVAVQRFEVVGDAQGVAYCHNVLGVCYYRLKEYKMALVHHKKQQVLSSQYGRAVAQLNLGVTYSALGELNFAEQAFQDAYHSSLEAQDAILETIALGNLGLTFMRLGDVRRSQSNMEQCLEHCSVAGDRVGSAVCLLLLGEIYSVVDDADHALFYFEHAFRVAGEAAVADLQEIARVSIGITRGNKNAKSSMTTFAQSLGQEVGMAELMMSLPYQ